MVSEIVRICTYHCDYGLVLLCLVPLVSLHGEDVLPVREGSHVPGNIVAPAGRLDPMNTSGIHPDDVARFLQKSEVKEWVFIKRWHIFGSGT